VVDRSGATLKLMLLEINDANENSVVAAAR
jgi:hypothetical protein